MADNGDAYVSLVSSDQRYLDDATNKESTTIEDVFFLVLGVTGAGKSTFVSQCSGQQAEIGASLESCTKEVECFTFEYGAGLRVHLIDSPGFDDTRKTDSDVLKDIANWMASSYKEKNQLLSGILMLHRVSDTRMTGGSMRNLEMFQKLCGQECFTALTLATTFWSNPPEKIHEEIEQELQKNYWSDMLNNGATYVRHEGHLESAHKILDLLVSNRKKVKTRIQVEMVDKAMRLDETSAGQQLNQELIVSQRKHAIELQELKKQHDSAIESHDNESANRFAELERRLKCKIDETESARSNLETDIARLQEEKTQGMLRVEEQLKDKFKEVDKRLKELKNQLHASEKDKASEKAALEIQLNALGRDLHKANRTKACRPTSNDDGSSFDVWIRGGLMIVGKLLGILK